MAKRTNAYQQGKQMAAGAAAYAREVRRKRQARRGQRLARAAKKFRNWYPRGSSDNQDRFGATYKEATDYQKLLRNAVGYRGRGDYRRMAGYIPRGLGAIGGFALDGFRGAAQGWATGGRVSKALGWGDYGIATNQIVGQSSQAKLQVNPSNNSGDIIFDHTEFIGNVMVQGKGPTHTGGPEPSAFSIQHFRLNPAQPAVFPFLSTLASQFEMYEFAGLMFQYKPLSGESANATNALGKVIMATNYDPSSPLFNTSHSMENYDYSCSCKPSAGMYHGIETEPSQRLTKQLYCDGSITQPGPSAPGHKDKMLTDLGLFQIATEGIPVDREDVIIGELWVTYKIKLSRAALSDVMQHQDLETMTIEMSITPTNASQGAASPLQFSNQVTNAPSNAIQLTQVPGLEVVGTTCHRVWEFPSEISTGTYRVTITCEALTADVGTRVNPEIAVDNLGYMQSGEWLVSPADTFTSVRTPSVQQGGGSSETTLVTSGYFRFGLPGRSTTKPSRIRVSFTNTGSGVPVLGNIVMMQISECNPNEALNSRADLMTPLV